MRANTLHLLGLLVAAVACNPAVAGQEATDMLLKDAGFVVRGAETPAERARLRAVPARKFLRRHKTGHVYYVYVDPDTCECAFVGDEDALKTYRDMVANIPNGPLGAGIRPELEINDMDAAAWGDVPEGDILDYKR
jgi:hypothetical protein